MRVILRLQTLTLVLALSLGHMLPLAHSVLHASPDFTQCQACNSNVQPAPALAPAIYQMAAAPGDQPAVSPGPDFRIAFVSAWDYQQRAPPRGA